MPSNYAGLIFKKYIMDEIIYKNQKYLIKDVNDFISETVYKGVEIDEIEYTVISNQNQLDNYLAIKDNEYTKLFFNYGIDLSNNTSNIFFDSCIFNKKHTILKNCTISSCIFNENNAKLKDCTFREKSTLGSGCTIESTTFHEKSILGDECTIENATFCEESILENKCTIKDTTFREKSTIGDECTIENATFYKESTLGSGCTIESTTFYKESTLGNKYTIKDTTFHEKSTLNSCKIESATFHEKSTLNGCTIKSAIFCEETTINVVTFIAGILNYTGVVFEKKVKFTGSIKTTISTKDIPPYMGEEIEYPSQNIHTTAPIFTFKSEAYFLHAVLDDVSLFLDEKKSSNGSLIFKSCNFVKKFKIRNTENETYEEQQKNKAKLKELYIIDCTADNEAYLRIGFLDVQDFKLENLRNPPNAELNIGDCHFHNFELANFRNLGKFKLFKINIIKNKEKGIDETKNNCEFNINNTSIGDTDFQSLYLDDFETVRMFDNILSGIDYTNIKWKTEIKVGQFNDDDVELAKKRDTYRVLKNVAQKNNDAPQALEFYVEEMKNHRKITKSNNGIFSIDRMVLGFNYWTNNFGLNWWRPIWVLFLAGIVFYALLLLSLRLDWWFEFIPLQEETTKIVGNFFVFLNPTHKIEFIGCKNSWGGFAYGIDFAFRLIEGLLIYQTIQAFRKYSRKL